MDYLPRPEHETKAGVLDTCQSTGLTTFIRRVSIPQVDPQHEFYGTVLAHPHVGIHDGRSVFLA